MSDSASSSAIVLGCSVAVVSSAIQSLGVTLQRRSHLLHIQLPSTSSSTTNECSFLNPNNNTHHQQQKYRRNMWYLGFSMFIIANVVGSAVQISTLPLIILSPLQSIGLIFNSIFSCLLLPGDHFTKKLWVGTGVIAIGAFTIAYNGSIPPSLNDDPIHNIDKKFKIITDKLLDPSFLVWFIGTFIFMGFLVAINKFYLDKKIKENHQHRQKFAIRGGDNNVLVVKFNKYQFWKGINYGIVSGTLTAHTFLFAKSIIDVIIETIMKDGFKNIFKIHNFVPYLLLITMFCIVGLQLTAFNLGLAQITTAILYPLCFLVYNLINLINDLSFNKLLVDHKMTYFQFTWVLIGLTGVLVGVLILSWDSAFQPGSDNVSAEDGGVSFNEGGYTDYVISLKTNDSDGKSDRSIESTALIENLSSNNSYDTSQHNNPDQKDNRLDENTEGEESNITNDTLNLSIVSDQNKNRKSLNRPRSLTYEQLQLLGQLDPNSQIK
ncbi:uncharacterized protein KGF55_005651 [Candida pseudojiufengensis]|uniref:uncharacterized protein n=1 Tax=Candida pseudojiufengensis TaxID=497109 RepID=UPI00222540FF|nr:uncharacterized protein KGF55_005651 [Candida pseudojiufengensis]KAI5958997.1 hypothetical protein KGF55_005651 [Candida pseudojiufengensis]